MVDIIVYQRHHVVGVALAVAVDARSGGGGLCRVTVWQQYNEQYGGGSSSGWDCNAPYKAAGTVAFGHAMLYIRLVYLFYQFVCIHILLFLRSFSLMRPMRVVTLVWLMPSIRPISPVVKPSR